MEYLTQSQVVSAVQELEGYGYPSFALINLLNALGIDSNKYNFSTDGETSMMPARLYEAVKQYARIAQKIKVNWKNNINPYDILPLLPDRTSGIVTLKMAKDALKVVMRGNIANVIATLENEAVTADVGDAGEAQKEATQHVGGNYHIYNSQYVCECGETLSVFASKNPFDGRPSHLLCFNCGAVHKMPVNNSGDVKSV